jgi:hypothetical protein
MAGERCLAALLIFASRGVGGSPGDGGETGMVCEEAGLVGVYTDSRHVIPYTSNDEVRQEFLIVLTVRPISGSPCPSEEAARWGGFLRRTSIGW